MRVRLREILGKRKRVKRGKAERGSGRDRARKGRREWKGKRGVGGGEVGEALHLDWECYT